MPLRLEQKMLAPPVEHVQRRQAVGFRSTGPSFSKSGDNAMLGHITWEAGRLTDMHAAS